MGLIWVAFGGGGVAGYRFVWRVVMLFLLVGLLLYAGHFAYHAFNLARAKGEVNYAESTWLFSALRVRHGLTPYFDYTHAPYIPMTYPPLLPGLAGWLGALFGTSDRQVITFARLFSLASSLAISGIVAIICRALGVSAPLAAVAGLLFLTPQLTFSLWSFAARSDMLAAAVALAAVAVLVLASCRDSMPAWSLMLGGALCGLALSAKQTAVAPLLALGLWLVLARQDSWRARISRIALVAVATLAGLSAALAPFGLDGTRQLLQGTLDLASQPQDAANFYTRLDNLVTMFGLCFPLSALGLWALIRARAAHDPASRAINLLLLYVATSSIVFLLTSAKLGSASSYCLETIAVLCVAAGVGLGSLERLVDGAERQVAVALLVLAIAPIATQSWYAFKTAQSSVDMGPDDGPLASLAQTGKGPVLSENGYILLNGTEPPYLLDPLFFSVQERAGKWDAGPAVQMVKERKFASVVLFHTIEARPSVNGASWLPNGLYDAIQDNYTLAGLQGRYYVYLPRNP